MRTVRRLRDLTLTAITAIVVGMAVSAVLAAPLSLTLIHVNDWDQMAGIEGAGGAARIAAVVAEERARAEARAALRWSPSAAT